MCDIGAYEFALPDLTVTKTSSAGSTVLINVPFDWIITIQNVGSGIAKFGGGQDVLIDELPTSGATYGTATIQNLNGGVTGGVTCDPISAVDPILDCYDSGSLEIPPGGSLQIVIPVTPTVLGTLTNPETRIEGFGCMVNPYLGELFDESNETNNTCAQTVTVENPAVPTIGKSFGAASIPVGGSTSLAFTITNPNSGVSLSGIGFTDTLPPGLVVSTPNGLTGSCGGTVAAVAGSNSISLTGGTLAPSGSCSFSVNVTGASAGVKANTTGAISSNESGQGGTASATLDVITVAVPTIGKSFGAASIAVGGSTGLTFTITNPNSSVSLSGVSFSDTLPPGLVVSTPNGLTGSCGGTVAAVAGSNSISLAGGTLAPSGSCSFSVNVTGTSAGVQANTTGAISSNESGQGGTASATLDVTTVAVPTMNEWGMIMFMLLAGLGSVFYLMRRRRTED